MRPPYRKRKLSLRGAEGTDSARWLKILNQPPVTPFATLREANQYWQARLKVEMSTRLQTFNDVVDVIDNNSSSE